MGLRINYNASAMGATRTLGATSDKLSKSIERLSSGMRINGAGDDPAGLVISEKLRAQVSGLGMAVKNAGDAVNMVKTAEGALNEVHSLLRSMRDLAVHAANTGANDAATAAADQAQIKNAIASINKIAAETQFGNKNLLDGSAGVKVKYTDSNVVTADLSKVTMTTATSDVNVNVTAAATHGTYGAGRTYTAATSTLGKTGYLTINNVRVDYTSTDTISTLNSKINAVSDQTGVTATLDGTNFDVELTSRGYGSVGGRIQIVDSNSVLLAGTTTTASAAGANAAATVTSSGTNNLTDASWTAGDGLTIKDSLGNSITLTQAGGTAVADLGKEMEIEKGTLIFQVGAYSGQTREVNIASVVTNNIGANAVTGKTVADLDVTTATGAQDAMKILDKAISDISDVRANLGATQKNVLESSINSLNVAKENIAASESSIRDTDMASEMVEFTKQQILNQAGVSMLSQANQAPQQLLSLLR